MTLSEFLEFWVYKFETLHRILYEASWQQQELLFVDAPCDLEGLSLNQLSPTFVTKVVKPWVKQLQAAYPETAIRIDVVNAPKILSIAWKLVIPLISPGTVAKIRLK